MPLRPRSIQARDTIVATVLAFLIFGAVAVVADLAIRHMVVLGSMEETQLFGRQVSAGIRDGSITGPTIPDRSDGGVLIQVVGPEGTVRWATPQAKELPPITDRWPSAEQRVQDFVECDGIGPGGQCMSMELIRVTTAPDSVVVYAGRPLPALLVTGLLEALLALATLALTALAAWTTWRIVGRTLRPVEQIRAQLAEIGATDLSRRVPQPAGQDEIAQLARTANETLDRLERAVARQRQFASDASHELRTPIAGLRANLEDAAMHPDDADLPATLASALRDTDRLESIVTDLLLLARIGTGGTAGHEPIDLSELADHELSRRAPDLKIQTRFAPGVQVTGVRMQLVRLLGNLLDNAERYAGERVEVEVTGEDDHARLTVTDDGHGIPEKDRERVFERFTRLDSARSRGAGGTGLGLAIAREIARAHGGSLHVEDHPRGARLSLKLPRTYEDESEPPSSLRVSRSST